MMKLSARNQLKGKVVEVTKGGNDFACAGRHWSWRHHYVLDHKRGRGRSRSQERRRSVGGDQGIRRDDRQIVEIEMLTWSMSAFGSEAGVNEFSERPPF